MDRAQPLENKEDIESERVLGLLLTELPLKKAVALTVEITGGRRNALYRRALQLAREQGRETGE